MRAVLLVVVGVAGAAATAAGEGQRQSEAAAEQTFKVVPLAEPGGVQKQFHSTEQWVRNGAFKGNWLFVPDRSQDAKFDVMPEDEYYMRIFSTAAFGAIVSAMLLSCLCMCCCFRLVDRCGRSGDEDEDEEAQVSYQSYGIKRRIFVAVFLFVNGFLIVFFTSYGLAESVRISDAIPVVSDSIDNIFIGATLASSATDTYLESTDEALVAALSGLVAYGGRTDTLAARLAALDVLIGELADAQPSADASGATAEIVAMLAATEALGAVTVDVPEALLGNDAVVVEGAVAQIQAEAAAVTGNVGDVRRETSDAISDAETYDALRLLVMLLIFSVSLLPVLLAGVAAALSFGHKRFPLGLVAVKPLLQTAAGASFFALFFLYIFAGGHFASSIVLSDFCRNADAVVDEQLLTFDDTAGPNGTVVISDNDLALQACADTGGSAYAGLNLTTGFNLIDVNATHAEIDGFVAYEAAGGFSMVAVAAFFDGLSVSYNVTHFVFLESSILQLSSDLAESAGNGRAALAAIEAQYDGLLDAGDCSFLKEGLDVTEETLCWPMLVSVDVVAFAAGLTAVFQTIYFVQLRHATARLSQPDDVEGDMDDDLGSDTSSQRRRKRREQRRQRRLRRKRRRQRRERSDDGEDDGEGSDDENDSQDLGSDDPDDGDRSDSELELSDDEEEASKGERKDSIATLPEDTSGLTIFQRFMIILGLRKPPPATQPQEEAAADEEEDEDEDKDGADDDDQEFVSRRPEDSDEEAESSRRRQRRRRRRKPRRKRPNDDEDDEDDEDVDDDEEAPRRSRKSNRVAPAEEDEEEDDDDNEDDDEEPRRRRRRRRRQRDSDSEEEQEVRKVRKSRRRRREDSDDDDDDDDEPVFTGVAPGN